MPRFSKIVATQVQEEPEASADTDTEKDEAKSGIPEKAREATYEVCVKRVALRKQASTGSQATLVLHKGERVCGTPCEVDGLRWLQISRKSMEPHPLSMVLEQEFAYVLMDGTGTDLGVGVLLKRAPTELGWCAADGEKDRSEVFEVVKGSAVVSKGKDPNEPEADVLLEGCIVKALEVDKAAGKICFELVAGDGPENGWVSMKRLTPVSQCLNSTGSAPQKAAKRPQQDEAKAAEAMRSWAEALWCKPEDDGKAVLFNREAFDWRIKPAKAEEAPELSEEELRLQLSEAIAAREGATAALPRKGLKVPKAGCCGMCCLPLGDTCYMHTKARKVHAECMAQLLLQELKRDDEARLEKDRTRTKLRHEEYKIGWRAADHIPLNFAPATKLVGRELPHGLYAVALAKDNAITIVPTACPAAAVNLEYLSVALKVRLDEGREPLFSLDPVDPDLKNTMQVKRFEPHWLKGTSAGDVLFESDYHLKELSFGAYEQPVVGMRSAFDFSDEEGFDNEWCAREWYIVRHAQVELSEDGVFIPCCKMGVEAREQVLKDGQLEDVKVTRQNHPMCRFAEAFTHNFDLIAERKSVVYHLRELAKASILAKYLIESDVGLEQLWLELYERKEGPTVLEVPQLWNERGHSQIHVKDGVIANSDSISADNLRAVYGGVQFGVDRFRMAPAAGAIQARRGFVPSRMGLARAGLPSARFGGLRAPSSALSARRGFIPPSRGFVAPAAAISARPGFFAPGRMGAPQMRGVDLNLNKFSLTDTMPSSRKGPVAFSENVEDAVTFGTAFWQQIDGTKESSIGQEEMAWLKQIFNSALSDRRSEGELFVPPDTNFSYGRKLKALLQEELEVLRKRKEHFFSTAFVMGNAGPIFPSAWTSDFEIARGRTPKTAPPPQAGLLEPRPDYKAEASHLRQALEAATPVFDQSTEEGLRWRIYRLGSLEVRTTQAVEGEEEVGAVFTTSTPGKEEANLPSGEVQIDESEKLDRIAVYVENDPEDSDQHAAHFYVVAETEKGSVIVTEKLKDGSTTWQENPRNIADRNSLAKVVKISDGLTKDAKEPATVKRLKIYQGSRGISDVSGPDRQRYAEGAFSRIGRPFDGRLTPESFDALMARHYPRLQALLGIDRLGARMA